MKKIGIFSTTFFFVDQIIKLAIKYFCVLNKSITIIPKFFFITYTENTGAAWSILEGNRIFLILITLVALFFFYQYFLKGKVFQTYETITYSLLLGGIFGNLMDRILYGSVIDYLDFRIFSYPFPIFNFADMCIVIGVGLLILDIIRRDTHGKNHR